MTAELLVFFHPTGSDGTLTRTPNDTTLMPGSSLRLNCGTDVPPILWSFTAENSASSVPMTSGGVLSAQFGSLFSIDSASLYDLVATSTDANLTYCGTYTCEDNDGGFGAASATATCSSEC